MAQKQHKNGINMKCSGRQMQTLKQPANAGT